MKSLKEALAGVKHEMTADELQQTIVKVMMRFPVKWVLLAIADWLHDNDEVAASHEVRKASQKLQKGV